METLQIEDVPVKVRDALHAEAHRRGESLQSYLLHVLTREAAASQNRGLARAWLSQPIPTLLAVDVSEVVRQQRTDRERQLTDILRGNPA